MSDRPGIIYAVENLVWPGWIKVGRAEGTKRDAERVVKRRVYQYNTGDPHRGYNVVAQAYASCCHDAERYVHSLLEIHCERGNGEWFIGAREHIQEMISIACTIARMPPKWRSEKFVRKLAEVRDSPPTDQESETGE